MSSLFDEESDTASAAARLQSLQLRRETASITSSGSRAPSLSAAAASQPSRRSQPTLGSSAGDAPAPRPFAPSGLLGGGGGLSGKSTLVPVVLLTKKACRGLVKSSKEYGNKMCVRDVLPGSDRCRYSSHQTKHHDYDDSVGYFYIVSGTSGGGDVIPDHRIAAEDCTDEMLNILQEERRTVEEWIFTFDDWTLQISERKARARVKVEEVHVDMDDDTDKVEDPDISMEEYSPLKRGVPPTAPKFDKEDDVASAQEAINTILSMIDSLKDIYDAFDDLDDKMADQNADKVEITEKLYQLIRVQANISHTMGDRKFIVAEYGSIAEAFYTLFTESEANKITFAHIDKSFDAMDEEVEEKIKRAREEYDKRLEDLKVELAGQQQRQPPSNQDLHDIIIDPATGLLNPDVPYSTVDGRVHPTFAALCREVTALKAEVKELRNMVEANGGFKIGTLSFNSLQEVKNLILKEHPSGSDLSLFTAFSSLAAHDVQLSAKEEAAYHGINPKLTSTDALVIHSVNTSMFPLYTGSAKTYGSGLLDCFKDGDETWNGDGDGRKEHIERRLDVCEDKVTKAAEQNLQHASTLKYMAIQFASKTSKFLRRLHTHFAADFKILASLKLPEADIYQLFSDVFQNIAEEMQSEFVGVQGVSSKVDPVDRLAELIWATGKAHTRMDEYLEKKFKHHEIVQSAFVRFLTKKTGQNSSASLGVKMTKLEKEVKAAANTAADSKRAATDALNKARQNADQLDKLKRNGK